MYRCKRDLKYESLLKRGGFRHDFDREGVLLQIGNLLVIGKNVVL